MSKILFYIFLVAVFCCLAAVTANAQISKTSFTRKTLAVTQKTGVIVVKSAAKGSYKATKFAAGKVAKPIVVKAIPAAGKFVVKKSLPLGRKLFVKYIKYKFL